MAKTEHREASTVEISMADKTRLIGKPIMRILCKKSDTLLGYLYEWNNGDLQPAWLNYATTNVRYEPMTEAA